MKKIIYKSFILVAAFLFVAQGCTDDFDEINTNPNQPEQITSPALLLPTIIRGTMGDHYHGSYRRGNIVADYLANQFVSAFDWTPSDAEDFFLWHFYGEMRNLFTLQEMATERGLNNYLGVSLVLKSYLFQSLTDIYGEIPYSEAINAKSDGINFPKYDTQEEIYDGILADLEQANSLLGSSSEGVTGDILYGGDILKWKKFANSLQLRCLLRLSDRRDPSAGMTRIVGDPVKYPLFESHEEQAALTWLEEVGNEFPRYRATNFSSEHASETFVNILKDLNDPRLSLFAQPTAATAGGSNPEYVGVPNGIGNEDDFNGGAEFQSPAGLLWSSVSWGELASPTAAESLLMMYSELQFILAEAAEMGYINGDAEAYYLNGINGNIDYYTSRIPENYTLPTAQDLIPDPSYFTQDNVAYTGTQEEKLQKLWLQKWISLFNSGFEGWTSWRKNGVPDIVAGPASLGFVPVRHLYPLSEQNLNNENYTTSVARQGPDNTQTKVWWDVQ